MLPRHLFDKRHAARWVLAILGALVVAYALADHPLYGGAPGYGKAEWAIGILGLAIAAFALMPVKVAEGALLLVLSSGFALGVAEVGGEVVLAPRFRPIYQADPDLIFSMRPGRVSEFTNSAANGGETVVHRINRDGFRGPELLPQGQATRVVVYGDSFIHAFYTADEHTFAARLAERLSTSLGHQVEVVNAGVSSYGPDQISRKMERELPRLQPDLVIVSIFAGNDFGDLLRNKLVSLSPDGELEDRAWTLTPELQVLFDLSQRESILRRVLREVRRSLRQQGGDAAQALDMYDFPFMLDEAEREYRSYQQDDVITNTHIDYYSADISLTPDRESARLKVRLMAAVLQRIRDVAASNGVPLALLFIPHPGDLPGNWGSWHIDPSRFPQYDGRRQTAVLEEMATAIGVPFLSLYDVFGTSDPNTLYLRNDDHWNDLGQDVASSAMVGLILQRGLLTPAR